MYDKQSRYGKIKKTQL